MLDNRNFIARLQEDIHKALAPLVPSAGRFALLDFPDHPNVGDSAIWLGEIEYFRKLHALCPAYICALNSASWDALQRAVPEGPIFLHGGGNFGDLWPAHQQFREDVLQRFRDRPVVQLPQSLHFSSRAALDRAAAVIRSHPDFTLLVRDRESLAVASRHFACKAKLCPDMAFCLGPLEDAAPASHPLLLLMRTDHERAMADGTLPPLPPGAVQADWLEDDPGFQRAIRRRTVRQLIPALGSRAFSRSRRRELLYRRLAESRLARGLSLLRSADFVISDRLHAHILCTLLDHPHIALDNSYGKVKGFIEAWTDGCHTTSTAPTLAAALEDYQNFRIGIG